MAMKAKKYRCRHPGCRTRETFSSPQQVLAHRVAKHGGKWPTEGKKRKRRTNGKIPTVPKPRGTRRESPYMRILQTIPMKDLMSEIARRVPEAE
jgi:hypothetical protein